DTLLAFTRGLSEALVPLAPSVFASFEAAQRRAMASQKPAGELCEWLSEHLRRCVCTILIDDLHNVAGDPTAGKFLAALIERTSDRITWILASRSDLDLPLASWVAYAKMDIPIGEADLRFTLDEALASADEIATTISSDDVQALLALTDGWPVALSIALRSATQVTDLRSASSGTREMVYRYLAEQVFNGVSEEQRSLLLRTAPFSTLDLAILGYLEIETRAIEELRHAVAFLTALSPIEYRYHDLFRDFLQAELLKAGSRTYSREFSRAGRVLEHLARYPDAIALYRRAGESAGILRILERAGLSLIECTDAETVGSAIDTLSHAQQQGNPAVLGLKAMLEANRGNFDVGERWYKAAIEAAARDPSAKIALIYRYAIELVRNDRDCIELLEPLARAHDLEPGLRVSILATLATAYVRAERTREAGTTMTHALELLDPTADDALRARVYQQAAYVQLFMPGRAQVRKYANLAIELALPRSLYEVAARAYSVLYNVVNDEDDDPIASLSILDRLGECARKGASSQVRLFGLIATFDIEVERGDDVVLARLDLELKENQTALPQARLEALLPARALRAAWNGDFRDAYDLLAGTAPCQATAERRALRHAEVALYALAAHAYEDGEGALREAYATLETCQKINRRTARTRLLIAIAELTRGHTAQAYRQLAEVERTLTSEMRRLRAFMRAVRALYLRQVGQVEPPAVAATRELLRSEHLGGMARLLEALVFPESRDLGYALLSPKERAVLRLLARGASTKEVAAQSGRSPQTVDTQIRSICRKLNCSGRRAAIALATSSGWVSEST
ncbi:MAG: LuxR C-terminal-related transcriptional regulator, partial [Candidatus Baltobacteraceae bacterium]